MQTFAQVCLQAVHTGGNILMEMRGHITPREKGPKDVVTEADLASQAAIRDLIKGAFPDHAFVGEEHELPLDGESAEGAAAREGAVGDGYCWVVDPLDGTLNYVHGLPGFAVSVALRRGDELLVGAILDPVSRECFTAERGAGARLNGVEIQPSACVDLEQALVAVSLPAQLTRESAEIARLIRVVTRAQSIRRLGSAALNLAYVGMGRLDAYYATSVHPWDVAAGALILQEAGGRLSNLEGAPFVLDDPVFAAAATPNLHARLIQALASAGE